MTDPARTAVRAEHPSLAGYLRTALTPEQRSRMLLVSFSQWEIVTSTVGEIAATSHVMGDAPIVALWADDTPVHDIGWTTSRAIARLTLSSSRDERIAQGLRSLGVPPTAFAAPPIRSWRPVGPLPEITDLYRTAIRKLEYRGAPVGRAILQVHPDKDTPITDDHTWPRAWVEACVRSYVWAFDQAAALIAERGATAVAVFNGRFLHDGAVAAAAEQAGIPVLAYDFGGNDTGFDLTIDNTHDWSALQRRMLRMYDEWDADERDPLGSRWFEDRRAHADPRNALFVESQTVGAGIERSADGRLVVFFSSSGDEISELDLDWSEFFFGQEGALQAVADACRARPDTTLLVRTHPHKRFKPKRDVADWHAAVAAAEPDIHLDEFSPVDSYTLMQQADVVVTYGSTTGVEAAYAQRPVVVMGPSAYDELGCATRVRTVEELEHALDAADVGAQRGAIAFGLMMNRRGFNYEHVRRTEDDRLMLGDVEIADARSVALKLSDILVRRSRGRLVSG